MKRQLLNFLWSSILRNKKEYFVVILNYSFGDLIKHFINKQALQFTMHEHWQKSLIRECCPYSSSTSIVPRLTTTAAAAFTIRHLRPLENRDNHQHRVQQLLSSYANGSSCFCFCCYVNSYKDLIQYNRGRENQYLYYWLISEKATNIAFW